MIRLVCGPPCSGKTTYVNEQAHPDDVIVEFDAIAQQLGSTSSHLHPFAIGRQAEQIVQAALVDIAAGHHPNAWVTRSMPNRVEREALATRLGAELIVLIEPREVLHQRALTRPDPTKTIETIDWWLAANEAATALDFFG